MGLWQRLRGVFRVHAERTVARLETPDVLADRAVHSVTRSREQAMRSLHAAKTEEIRLRHQIDGARQQAEVYRDRAATYLRADNRPQAKAQMVEAVRLEQLANALEAQLTSLQTVNGELLSRVEELRSQERQVGAQAALTRSRAATADALQGVATARFGDPRHPGESPREMLQRAADRVDTTAAAGEAAFEIGAAMPSVDSDVFDLDRLAGAELDALDASVRGELPAGTGASVEDKEGPGDASSRR